MRISDWSSDVCSSDLGRAPAHSRHSASSRTASGNCASAGGGAAGAKTERRSWRNVDCGRRSWVDMPVLTVPTRGGRVRYRPHHVRPGVTGGYPCTGAVSTIAYARNVADQQPVDPPIAVGERQDQPVPPGDLDVVEIGRAHV